MENYVSSCAYFGRSIFTQLGVRGRDPGFGTDAFPTPSEGGYLVEQVLSETRLQRRVGGGGLWFTDVTVKGNCVSYNQFCLQLRRDGLTVWKMMFHPVRTLGKVSSSK